MLTVDRHAPDFAVETEAESDPLADELQLVLFDEVPSVRAASASSYLSSPRSPTPSSHDVRRLSYSALALYERCSYRYFAERVLGLPPRERASRGEPTIGLAATEIGDAVHRLLELVPLDDPAVPPPVELEHAVRESYPDVSAEEARAHRLLGRGVLPLGSRPTDRGAARCSAGAAVHVRARRRGHPRPSRRPLARGHTCSRRRLQVERARGSVARGDHRVRVLAPAARVRTRVSPRRVGEGRDRVPVPRAPRRCRVDDVHRRRRAVARG